MRQPFTKPIAPLEPDDATTEEIGRALQARTRHLFGRSMAVFVVDAGSFDAGLPEIDALLGPAYDAERFGISFVNSPRHADVLLVTGPVTSNMASALAAVFAAMPDPKWVIAVGDGAAGKGGLAGSYAISGPVSGIVPVDLHLPGEPTRPIEILAGLRALLRQVLGRKLVTG